MMASGDARALADLLDRTHQALRTGDLTTLAALAQDTEAAFGRLDPAMTTADLEALRHRALRNAACLTGALRGVRAARRRLAEIAAAGKGLGTYDRAGRLADPLAATGQMTQRL